MTAMQLLVLSIVDGRYCIELLLCTKRVSSAIVNGILGGSNERKECFFTYLHPLLFSLVPSLSLSHSCRYFISIKKANKREKDSIRVVYGLCSASAPKYILVHRRMNNGKSKREEFYSSKGKLVQCQRRVHFKIRKMRCDAFYIIRNTFDLLHRRQFFSLNLILSRRVEKNI